MYKPTAKPISKIQLTYGAILTFFLLALFTTLQLGLGKGYKWFFASAVGATIIVPYGLRYVYRKRLDDTGTSARPPAFVSDASGSRLFEIVVAAWVLFVGLTNIPMVIIAFKASPFLGAMLGSLFLISIAFARLLQKRKHTRSLWPWALSFTLAQIAMASTLLLAGAMQIAP